jgi:cobalt-zinc-cadmium efflux system membrane fusion protein
MQHRKTIFVLGIILEILLFCSCNTTTSKESSAGQNFCIPDSLLKNVTFDTLHSESVISELSLSGKITFNEDDVAKIFPLVSGHVSDVKVSLGDYVEKGTVLAVIRSSDMANYFNDFKSSQSELAIAQKNLEVTGNMRSSGVSSEKDYLVAQNEYQKALAQYNKVKEVLKINGSSFSARDSTGSGYVIKAPISGFIAEKNITLGMDIRPDANDNLFTISNLREVWAIANVYETDISKIKVGNIAEITTVSYPDKKFRGKVGRISNILDPETKVMSVKILLQNKDFELKPGMYAKITLTIPENKNMLSVKSSTIIFDDNVSYLLRYRSKCDVSLQKVTIFKSLNDRSFVESDSLKVNDIAIARNGLFIFTAIRNL